MVAKVEQERQATIIRAEGESEAAKLISDATTAFGMGLIELRKIEASREIVATLAKTLNVAYLPNANNMLLGFNPSAADVVFIAEPLIVPWTAKTILQVIEQVEVEYVPEKDEFDGHLDEEFRKDSLDSLYNEVLLKFKDLGK
ncbi:hypothetical protein ACSBR1_000473 [Camellia fascicularis]